MTDHVIAGVRSLGKTGGTQLRGPITLTEGTGITISQVGQVLTISSSITQYTDEMARDALAAALTAGAGITITPNDGADTITVASSITQYTDEMAQDAVGTILTDSTEIDFTYADATPSITAAIVTGSVVATKLAAAVQTSLGKADTAVQPNTAPTFSGLTVDTSVLYVDATNNRVGINTTGPDDSLHVVGNFRFSDADGGTETKSMRFRTNGGDIDVEGAGKAIFWSVWSAVGYSGTQRNKLVMKSDAEVTEACKVWEFKDAPFGSTQLEIDGSTGIIDFKGTMGNSTKDPATQAPADWVQVEIGGTTYYLPAYAA